MENKNKFNKRGFISSGLLITLIGLPFSGLINHYLGFDGFTKEKHLWMSVHNMLGVSFIVFSVFHIILNRKLLWNSLRKTGSILFTREAGYACIIITLLLLLVSLHAVHLNN